MKQFLKNELTGWSFGEVFWLFFSCAVIVGLSIYWGDSLMGMISSTAGIAYSICAGKGKLSAYFFGVINSLLYGMISFEAQLYGETMLNILYYFPMQFVGFYVWRKNMNQETHEVKKRYMSNRGRVLLVLAIAVSTWLYGLFLKRIGDAMPFIDAFTTAASVIALIISIGMYAEQWWIWLVVNALSVYMWWCNFRSGSDNMATLLMWVVYLITAVLMIVKWGREAKEKESCNKAFS